MWVVLERVQEILFLGDINILHLDEVITIWVCGCMCVYLYIYTYMYICKYLHIIYIYTLNIYTHIYLDVHKLRYILTYGHGYTLVQIHQNTLKRVHFLKSEIEF